MTTPLVNIGPGGDFTRDHLLVDPVSDEAKTSSVEWSFTYNRDAEREKRAARALIVTLLTIAFTAAAIGVSLVLSAPGAAWIATGGLIAGFYVRFHPGR